MDDVGAACGACWERRDAYTVLVGKHEGKRALGKRRRRWDDITMDVKEMGWEGMDWIDLA
jgi:hypothetical protein